MAEQADSRHEVSEEMLGVAPPQKAVGEGQVLLDVSDW